MITPWGDVRVSDAHVHFFSHRFLSLLAVQQRAGASVADIAPLLGWEMPPEDPLNLANRWAGELDRHGVARAALIASLPGDESSVTAAIAAHPARFLGYFMVNPTAQGGVGRGGGGARGGLAGALLFSGDAPLFHA